LPTHNLIDFNSGVKVNKISANHDTLACDPFVLN